MSRRAIIIGAGPAGLTAAYELLARTDVVPVVIEKGGQVGGISKTVVFEGNRLDMGGHRFFSKSDRVMDWWLDMLPLQRIDEGGLSISYHGRSRNTGGGDEGPDPDVEDRVMLVRGRRSSIFYAGQFFDYPLSLRPATLLRLGVFRTARIGASYLRSAFFPIRPERNLEEFLINRFGRELYHTFFKSYTEKVWGVPCQEISAAWGAQRIKDVSVGRALRHWLGGVLPGRAPDPKRVPTSLVERFLYPKHGPGQMWE